MEEAGPLLKTGDYGAAQEKLLWAANLGSSDAQLLLGDLYALGWGVQGKDETAIKWYRRAGSKVAGLSDPAAPAMYYIGLKLLKGEGVTADPAKARIWFERSAHGGFNGASKQQEWKRCLIELDAS